MSSMAPLLPPRPLYTILPIDETGESTAPITPTSNVPKPRKMKFRIQRVVRRGRRILMRKGLLKVLLGRKLAGPVREALISDAKQQPLDGHHVGTGHVGKVTGSATTAEVFIDGRNPAVVDPLVVVKPVTMPVL